GGHDDVDGDTGHHDPCRVLALPGGAEPCDVQPGGGAAHAGPSRHRAARRRLDALGTPVGGRCGPGTVSTSTPGATRTAGGDPPRRFTAGLTMPLLMDWHPRVNDLALGARPALQRARPPTRPLRLEPERKSPGAHLGYWHRPAHPTLETRERNPAEPERSPAREPERAPARGVRTARAQPLRQPQRRPQSQRPPSGQPPQAGARAAHPAAPLPRRAAGGPPCRAPADHLPRPAAGLGTGLR